VIGLALGAGGARGVAHAGVLRALRRRPDLLPEVVAGTSVGSIFAALYAADVSQRRIEAEAGEFEWVRDVVDLGDSLRKIMEAPGLVSNARLGDVINDLLGGRGFDDLPRDLAVVASDLVQRTRIIFTSRRMAARMDPAILESFLRPPEDGAPGCRTEIVSDMQDVGLAVQASCAVPGVFVPVEVSGRLLWDGGAMDQVPVDVVCAAGVSPVVAVGLGWVYYPKRITRPATVVGAMVAVMNHHQVRRSFEMADLAFHVDGIDNASLVKAHQADLIALGETSMGRRLNRLAEVFSSRAS
jgi:NTE family protein